MSVVTPPRRPGSSEQQNRDALEALDALIEEARRRARRRRRRYGACVFLLAAAAGSYLGFGRGGGDRASLAPTPAPSAAEPAVHADLLDRSALLAGRLTLIGLPAWANGGVSHHAGRPGWFDVSMLDKGGRLRPLIRCPGKVNYCGIVEGFDWSPDGKQLAFSVGTHITPTPHVGLHVLDTTTGADRRLWDARACFGMRRDVAWSPDGSKLAYVCSGKIVVVTPGESPRLLRTGTEGSDSSPTWAPAGDRIAFATTTRGTAAVISLIGVDGSGRVKLATEGTAPDWSPDGAMIAYRAGCGGVKLVTPQGGDMTPVREPVPCRALGVDGMPVWLPGGEQIAINNRTGLYLVDRDGSQLRRISAHTGIGHHGGRPAWRPGS